MIFPFENCLGCSKCKAEKRMAEASKYLLQFFSAPSYEISYQTNLHRFRPKQLKQIQVIWLPYEFIFQPLLFLINGWFYISLLLCFLLHKFTVENVRVNMHNLYKLTHWNFSNFLLIIAYIACFKNSNHIIFLIMN